MFNFIQFLKKYSNMINLRFILMLWVTPVIAEVDFNRQIRPILSDKCFKGHGPDAKNQKFIGVYIAKIQSR